jgi:hypothetical protein
VSGAEGYDPTAADAFLEAQERLEQRTDRDARGRWAPGNSGALVHGGRSRQALESAAAVAVRLEKQAALHEDLGGDLGVIKRDLGADYLTVDTMITTVTANIERQGVLTATGKRRAAVDLLLSLIDRRLRLAERLGIERRQKAVPSLNEYLATRSAATTDGGAAS